MMVLVLLFASLARARRIRHSHLSPPRTASEYTCLGSVRQDEHSPLFTNVSHELRTPAPLIRERERPDVLFSSLICAVLEYTDAGGSAVVTLECGPGSVIFKVVDNSSGLALTHVKELVERLGGRIDVGSAPNRGTTFTITLPNAHCAPPELSTVPFQNEINASEPVSVPAPVSLISPREVDSAFLHKVDAVIAAELGNPAFDIQTLCARLHLSAKQTQRKVRMLTGLTPMEYLRQTRLRRAEELLLQGESVSRVAYSTGFSSQSYFTTCFKKWAGETPRSWQKRQLTQPTNGGTANPSSAPARKSRQL